MFRDVGSNQCLLPYLVGGEVACETMEIHAQHCGFLGRIALRQKREDDARQHIAAARRGHARIARGVEEDGTVGHRDRGVRAFHDDDKVVFRGQFPLFLKALKRGRGFPHQAFKLFGMWRQYRFGRQERQPSRVVGEDVQGIGIHD